MTQWCALIAVVEEKHISCLIFQYSELEEVKRIPLGLRIHFSLLRWSKKVKYIFAFSVNKLLPGCFPPACCSASAPPKKKMLQRSLTFKNGRCRCDVEGTFQMTLKGSKDSEWWAVETFTSHTHTHTHTPSALNPFLQYQPVLLCSSIVDIYNYSENWHTLCFGLDWQLRLTTNECQWDVCPTSVFVCVCVYKDVCVCVCVCVCWQVQGLPLLSPSVWGRINLPVSHLTPPACYATYHEQYLCVCVCVCVLSFCQPLSCHPPSCMLCFLSVCPPFWPQLSLLRPSFQSPIVFTVTPALKSDVHSTFWFPIICRFCFAPTLAVSSGIACLPLPRHWANS